MPDTKEPTLLPIFDKDWKGLVITPYGNPVALSHFLAVARELPADPTPKRFDIRVDEELEGDRVVIAADLWVDDGEPDAPYVSSTLYFLTTDEVLPRLREFMSEGAATR
jgi:hypothetical protein